MKPNGACRIVPRTRSQSLVTDKPVVLNDHSAGPQHNQAPEVAIPTPATLLTSPERRRIFCASWNATLPRVHLRWRSWMP